MKQNRNLRLKKNKKNLSVAAIFFQSLLFLPLNFRQFFKRTWLLALFLIVGSFEVLLLAVNSDLSLRGILLPFYFLLLCGAYAATAVMLCRGQNSTDECLPTLHLGKTEMLYMLYLLRFWFLFAATIICTSFCMFYIFQTDLEFETMAFALAVCIISCLAIIFIIVNLQLCLPALVKNENPSFATVWKLGNGYRLKMFLSVAFLLTIILLVAALLIIYIPQEPKSLAIAVFIGVWIFFLDVSWQTVFLTKIYNALKSKI